MKTAIALFIALTGSLFTLHMISDKHDLAYNNIGAPHVTMRIDEMACIGCHPGRVPNIVMRIDEGESLKAPQLIEAIRQIDQQLPIVAEQKTERARPCPPFCMD